MAAYATYRHIEIDNIGFGKKRVLKPPGGGSSDIFGSPEPPASHSLRKTRTFDQQTSGTVMNGTKSPTDSTPSSTTSSTGNHSHLDLTPPHHQQQSEPNPPQVNGGSADYDHESESSPLPEDAVEAEIDEKYSSSSLDETASNGSLEQSLSECKIESNNQTTVTTHSSSESVSSSVSSSSSSVRTKSASHSRIFGDDSDEWKQKKKVHVNGNHLNGGAQNGGAVDGTDGNPVTGDGYEPAPVKDARSNSTTSTGTADFKPRTRVPPGGFSSGLW